MPHSDTAPDLVVVGAASRDQAADDPRGWRLGGTATYAALTAARLGLRVGCVLGVDGPASGASELTTLEEAGVLLRRVELGKGPVFDNIEIDGHRRQRWTSASDEVPVAALPAEWRNARGWLMGPIAGEVGPDWAAAPGRDARVCLGWQGLLRRFAPDGWVERVEPARSVLLDRAGLVCASLDDVPSGSRLDDLRRFAPSATVVLTAGARGGLVSEALAADPGAAGEATDRPGIGASGRGLRRYLAIAATPRDPTGAGDVFMATLMAAWLLTGDLATSRALRLAAAAGSCAVEAQGLAGVPTRQEVVARLRVGRSGQSQPSNAVG